MEDGGWIYVSNCEVRDGRGGAGALRFDRQGTVIDSYSILENTSINCAGGATPWNTWLSCEEHEDGQVWECDPTGQRPAQVRPALGTFSHEAVAVDPVRQHLYLTEDQPNGGFYRFVPANPLPDLSTGRLEIASVAERDGRSWISWHAVPDPQATSTLLREQVPAYTPFRGGEGIAYQDGRVYFTTKRDNRVWWHDVQSSELGVLYDIETSDERRLSGVDNVAITPAGDVLIAEDRGDMQIVVLTPSGKITPLVQVLGQDSSEITGPAFDPLFQRLYFSSQRGTAGNSAGGITYEITATGLR
jgi:secreted PhoX family phosphatase